MHSELAIATRPYIWREVLVAFGSHNKTEAGLSRLERSQRPHIAPFVRAVFASFYFPGGGSEESIPLIVTAIPLFKSLRSVCLGTFQNDSQPRMYKDVAKVIREHPSIDTISVYYLTQCADLIQKDASRAYHIELEYSHENSIPLTLRPKAIKFLRIQNDEPQKFKKNWPPNIWDSLKHPAPGPDDADYPPQNHRVIQSSLRRYLDQGRRPALKSLDDDLDIDVASTSLRPFWSVSQKFVCCISISRAAMKKIRMKMRKEMKANLKSSPT
ncbi:hypothetical protein C8R43DRAFT_645133 [Mycena crocata]|nr:hypothetical protein C8R43DRAFT_645133 [Mycena crocata]